MKNYLIILLLLTSFLTSYSQLTDDVLGKAYYTLKHKREPLRPDSVYKENMVLYMGTNASLFKSYDGMLQIEAIEKDLEQ